MTKNRKKYITLAIPYVNAKPHIGTAIEMLYGDVLARYYRQEGYAVQFVSGTDEHGQKVERTAVEKGMTAQAYVDNMSASFQELITAWNISIDDFIRTTQPRHQETAQALWRKIVESGDVEKGTYEGWYCIGCEAFKTEKELVDGNCPIHLKPVQHTQEENYFFCFSRYQNRLLEWYEAHPDFVVPKAKFREMKELVKNGLEDVSISREKEQLSWGIPVPGDDTQVMYVWFEALMNYLSVIDYGRNKETFAKWWPADIQIVGKDINRFHSVLWPAMLMAAGVSLPCAVGVHGFITVNGQKMSKSLGNIIDPIELTNQYGVEPVRYFLMREIAFDSDGDFSHHRLQQRYSSELANGLGNLLSRVTNMVEKYFDGKLEAIPAIEKFGESQKTAYHEAFAQLAFHAALDAVWSVVDSANEYIEQQKPWVLAKSDHQQLQIVLQHLLFCLELIAEWLVPFMPETAAVITNAIEAEHIDKAEPLFPRLALEEDSKV
ncbi:MAG: methionine--tRNA ligase [Candidatus Kerfeldbacteria bacterium]|nr:methionine--tRNA ligase [Candidatus Kerfeldbacteria bacterium]